jgi:uncharacterized MAPEG superfamily protein
MFAPLALIAALVHVSNSWTVLAAQLFFYSRVAHAVVYIAGWRRSSGLCSGASAYLAH